LTCVSFLLPQYLLLGKPMSDVAVAEGDAEKGEIVISPAVHDLLHNFASVSASAGIGASPGQSAAADATTPPDGTYGPHTLSCGCERMPSGYYKIRNTLDEMLCVVDFGAKPAVADLADASSAPEDREMNEDIQFEFDVYAQIVEELMQGYKVVSPQLHEKFAGVIDKLALTAQAGTGSL
jgi:hypothetical protein